MLLTPIINVRDEQQHKNDQKAGRARYMSVPELVIELLESEWSRVWAAWTWDGMAFFAGLACSGSEPGPERNTAAQSSQNWRKSAADGARR